MPGPGTFGPFRHQEFAMTSLLTSLTALVLLASPVAPDGDKALEPFQGKWKITSVMANGEALPKESFQNAVLTVKGDERVIKEGDEVKSRAKFKVDAAKSPKTIDIEILENAGDLKGKTLKGVYEIMGDTM